MVQTRNLCGGIIRSVRTPAKSPWLASLVISATLVLVTVGLNLARGTYRHSVGDRIYGDVVVWLLGACIVRVVIFVMSRLSGMRKSG